MDVPTGPHGLVPESLRVDRWINSDGATESSLGLLYPTHVVEQFAPVMPVFRTGGIQSDDLLRHGNCLGEPQTGERATLYRSEPRWCESILSAWSNTSSRLLKFGLAEGSTSLPRGF